ncbi:metal-dependent transcriptional regulator [Actinomycetaceae bacterium TAE3-ERU4]|nr:metal-dependent transcriptional regulator [Actinomycetaceae bacterium TAE3-ERU4]
MSNLIDTTEMYLKTIFELEEDSVAPLRARIVERLGHSGPTVSQTVGRMERDGLLSVRSDRQLTLTPQGRKLATSVMRKHRLAERLLLDVLKMDQRKVHDEACRWEHVISDEAESQLIAVLEDPRFDPFGNPIPLLEGALEETSLAAPGTALEDVQIDEQPREVVVNRIGEPVQGNPKAIALLLKVGAVPGAKVKLFREGENILISAPQGTIEVTELLGRHLFVDA